MSDDSVNHSFTKVPGDHDVSSETTHHVKIPELPPYKIALCFLVIGTIDHEDIWADWLKPYLHLFSIYIHSKNKFQPSTSLFQEHSKQVKTFPTCWGCFSLVQATNQLVREAMADDPLNYKFVLLSNTCIPVKPFLKVYQFLTRDNLTHISYFSKSMLDRALAGGFAWKSIKSFF